MMHTSKSLVELTFFTSIVVPWMDRVLPERAMETEEEEEEERKMNSSQLSTTLMLCTPMAVLVMDKVLFVETRKDNAHNTAVVPPAVKVDGTVKFTSTISRVEAPVIVRDETTC